MGATGGQSRKIGRAQRKWKKKERVMTFFSFLKSLRSQRPESGERRSTCSLELIPFPIGGRITQPGATGLSVFLHCFLSFLSLSIRYTGDNVSVTFSIISLIYTEYSLQVCPEIHEFSACPDWFNCRTCTCVRDPRHLCWSWVGHYGALLQAASFLCLSSPTSGVTFSAWQTDWPSQAPDSAMSESICPICQWTRPAVGARCVLSLVLSPTAGTSAILPSDHPGQNDYYDSAPSECQLPSWS